MRRFLVIMFLLSFMLQSDNMEAYSNDCQGWAQQIGAGNGSKRMRLMGCHDSRIRGRYEPISGTCNYLARQQARLGYRTYQIPPRIKCAYDTYSFYYIYQYTVR